VIISRGNFSAAFNQYYRITGNMILWYRGIRCGIIFRLLRARVPRYRSPLLCRWLTLAYIRALPLSSSARFPSAFANNWIT